MAIWALFGGFSWSSTPTFQVFVFLSLGINPTQKRGFERQKIIKFATAF
jgi:hypothetical protein